MSTSGRLAAAGVAAALLAGLVAACQTGGGSDGNARFVFATAADPRFDVTVEVIDEAGAPVVGATVDVGDEQVTTGAGGLAELRRLDGATLAIVSAPGFLTEPAPVGFGDAGGTVRVRLFDAAGRIAVHFGGDAMFGRRYENPEDGTDPLIPANDAGDGARDVVRQLARAFAVADLSLCNLETVLGTFSDAEAYPGKRFILQSRPETTDGLEELGVDAVILANNHARDFLDVGVAELQGNLDAAGIEHVGASSSGAVDADVPLVVNLGGTSVGLIAWTTVDGDFVNDSYPLDTTVIPPPPLGAIETLLFEFRLWDFQGATLQVNNELHRAGSAWQIFDAAEAGLPAAERDAAFASLTAVFPEIIDLVERRGHGGAAKYVKAESDARLATLEATTDLQIASFHSGFQFQEASSKNLRKLAREAIDAGADVVVGHHPHILQGMEFYKGKLIVYSLANFVFEQLFLVTFRSAFLRMVWEDDVLIDARLVPVELDAFVPSVSAGDAARVNLFRMWERSVLGAHTDRDSNGEVTPFEIVLDPDTEEAHVVLEGSTARITPTRPNDEAVSVQVPGDTTVAIGFDGLVHGQLGLGGTNEGSILVGRDLFGWGRFEDELADGQVRGGTHWDLAGNRKRIVVGDAPEGERFLQLTRFSTNADAVAARPVARVALPRHRLFEDLGGKVRGPLDPEPEYRLVGKARLRGVADTSVRFTFFAFDDTDPTVDPESVVVDERTIDLDVTPNGGWQDFEVAVPSGVFDDADPDAFPNQVLFFFRLEPPRSGVAQLELDDVAFLELREASGMPDRFGLFTHIRNDGGSRTVQVIGLPADGGD